MSSKENASLRVATIRHQLRSGTAREIRERAGISQAEVARTLGVHALTVAAWESGRKAPRFDIALRYADLLDQLATVGQ